MGWAFHPKDPRIQRMACLATGAFPSPSNIALTYCLNLSLLDVVITSGGVPTVFNRRGFGQPRATTVGTKTQSTSLNYPIHHRKLIAIHTTDRHNLLAVHKKTSEPCKCITGYTYD
ncbi:hypothetical protein J6590_104331 [Homalodisca vitripennis]|nr:hypothetical protein J6590_104331 [Homalodisca vitripennis]